MLLMGRSLAIVCHDRVFCAPAAAAAQLLHILCSRCLTQIPHVASDQVSDGYSNRLFEQPAWQHACQHADCSGYPLQHQQHTTKSERQQQQHVQQPDRSGQHWMLQHASQPFGRHINLRISSHGSPAGYRSCSLHSTASLTCTSNSSVQDGDSVTAAAQQRLAALDGQSSGQQVVLESVDADVFGISNYDKLYQQTLRGLRVGRTKNLSELAQAFDPQAVAAAPDKGAAILEALMFGAAKLGDLQLLRQLLRCMAAAGSPLSATGHTAVLHGLAQADRPKEALAWLQQQVPKQLVSGHMVRSLVQPLLQVGHVNAAEQVLQFVGVGTGQLTGAAAATAGREQQIGALRGISGSNGACHLAVNDDLQVLPCLRLMVAAAKGTLEAVQSEWAAIQLEQQQQQHLSEPMQQQQHPQVISNMSQEPQQPIQPNVSVWASYVSALGRVGKHHPGDVHQIIRGAMDGLASAYHAAAWAGWVDAHGSQQQHSQQHPQQWVDLGAQQHPESLLQVQQQRWQRQQEQQHAQGSHAKWLLQQQQQQSQQLWQQASQQLHSLSWQDLNPATTLPAEVAAAVRHEERDLTRRALDAAVHMAAAQLDAAWMDHLLKMASLLQLQPASWSFDALCNQQVWQGATPEALEELLQELMGWRIVPTLSHYEHLMEAYALHRDLSAAENMLDRLQAVGHMPVLRTYNRLLHGIAINGDLHAAARVYARLKAQGLLPDVQTMRTLFKCVRMYAQCVRVFFARQMAHAKPGDREIIQMAMSQRNGLFAAAYGQLANWQAELVLAGLRHSKASLHQLMSALERLGATEDCIQLAKLHESLRPGSIKAHRFALQATGRQRGDPAAAGQAASIAASMKAQGHLSRQDYASLIATQFWVHQDYQQLLETVAAMWQDGHELSESVLVQLLHVYCHTGMWGEALQVLDDVAAGRVKVTGPDVADYAPVTDDWQHSNKTKRQAGAAAAAVSAPSDGAQHSSGAWRSRKHLQPSTSQPLLPLHRDTLWHVILRKLWEQRASDSLLNDFIARMPSQLLQRFKLIYNLQRSHTGEGYTMQPLEEWQLPTSQKQPQQQQQQQPEAEKGQLQQQPQLAESAEQQEQAQQQQTGEQQFQQQQQHLPQLQYYAASYPHGDVFHMTQPQHSPAF